MLDRNSLCLQMYDLKDTSTGHDPSLLHSNHKPQWILRRIDVIDQQKVVRIKTPEMGFNLRGFKIFKVCVSEEVYFLFVLTVTQSPVCFPESDLKASPKKVANYLTHSNIY